MSVYRTNGPLVMIAVVCVSIVCIFHMSLVYAFAKSRFSHGAPHLDVADVLMIHVKQC